MKSRYKSIEGQRLIQESYDKLLTYWDVEIENLDIPTTWGTTRVITAGDKANPPLVLLHGVSDDSALMWIYNAKELAKHFMLYAVDTLGGPGKSEPNEEYLKSFDQPSWLNEVIDALGLKSIDLVGVSNGAAIAINYMIHYPHKAGRIVLMAGGGKGGMLKMLKFVPAVLFPSEKTALKLQKALCGPNISMFTDNADIMAHWGYLLKYFNNSFMMKHKPPRVKQEEIDLIKGRSLLMMGEDDGLANIPNSIQFYEENGINYRIFKNAGHALNHQQPDIVHKEILAFLKP